MESPMTRWPHGVALWAMFAVVILLGSPINAEEDTRINKLHRATVELITGGKLDEASASAEQYVAEALNRFGEEDLTYAAALELQAIIWMRQGRLRAAEAPFQRVLAIREKNLPVNDYRITFARTNLASLYRSLGRNAEALALLAPTLAEIDKRLQKTVPRADVPSSTNELDELHKQVLEFGGRGDFKQATILAERYVDQTRIHLGKNHRKHAEALFILSVLYNDLGRGGDDATSLLEKALAIQEEDPSTPLFELGLTLQQLAYAYFGQGRVEESLSLLEREIAIQEKVLSPGHLSIVDRLEQLALLYGLAHRHAEATSLLKRALLMVEKALGPNDPKVAEILEQLGTYATDTNEGEAQLKRALEIREGALPEGHPDIIHTLDALALHYQVSGPLAKAEAILNRTLALREKLVPADNVHIANNLSSLASLYTSQGRLDEAETLRKRAVTMSLAEFPSGDSLLVSRLGSLGELYLLRKDWQNALQNLRLAVSMLTETWGAPRQSLLKATDLLQAIQTNGASHIKSSVTDFDVQSYHESQLRRNSYWFQLLIRALDGAGARTPSSLSESYEVAQNVQRGEASAAILQMAARHVKENDKLASSIRAMQDLERERTVMNQQLKLVIGREDHRVLVQQISTIDQRLRSLEDDLVEAFPNYSHIAHPKSISVTATQALLAPDEALVLFLDMPEMISSPEETFIWVITKGDMRWMKSELGTKGLTERVAALRCGLDRTAWSDASSWPEVTDQQKREKTAQIARRKRCLELLKHEPAEEMIEVGSQIARIVVLPFDLMRAHELYKGLLEPVEDMIKGKRLLIVPSGPLTSIPFNVLVTKPPKAGIPERLVQYRDVLWLGSRSAITVLPSVASLKALRQFAKPSRATKPYLGIGNPLLDGVQDDPLWGDYYKEQAALARTKRCSQASTLQQIASAPETRSAHDFRSIFRGAQADIEDVRSQEPLPESADELCEIARRLGVPESDILLGTNATEARLKDLSDQGRLADYAIVHFATHGTLTGQVQGLAEPGLILTPPFKGTSDSKALERDDGFLTASEITMLKLDADWVVLSACNTAGPQDLGAEALSGLARAFFYAGARAILVSHWAVGSGAAVKLTTRAFAELKAHPEIGRAEALRVSMKELIEKGDLAEAHPRQWAPFVVVGEGAAR
jgi:CHAT domain-containing protein/tetratricopeptide (TPR) repeat protein